MSKPFAAALLLVVSPAAFPQAAKPVETYPDRARILSWSPQEITFAFRNMEKISTGHVVKRGSRISVLPYASQELAVHYQYQGQDWDTRRFMDSNSVAGLLVIHDGKILLERYALGLDENGRWTSFSVAKSFTSTLVGAAVKDGKIASIDDPVTKYLPGLNGSGYDGATIRNVLNMASGVKWNEDYVDPKSDVSSFSLATDTSRGSALVTYMSKLPRDVTPGTKFNYNTGETNLVGELLMAATGKTLAAYLQEKVWTKLGMEHDAFWMLSGDGKEMGGCCLSVSLRDYGRFAQFVLGGAKGLVDPDWIAQATRPSEFSKDERGGYGYQWWTGPEGTFFATGIFGQNIQFFPDDKLIIVSLSAWPVATNRDRSAVRRAYVLGVRDAVRARRKSN